MTAHATLSAEARDRIVRLLEIDAQQDGSARQDLREFERFLTTAGSAPEPRPDTCDECSTSLSYYGLAVCLSCFRNAQRGDARRAS